MPIGVGLLELRVVAACRREPDSEDGVLGFADIAAAGPVVEPDRPAPRPF